MSAFKLRIMWPILDDSMFNHEAIHAAWLEWPRLARNECRLRRVVLTGTPSIRVVDLDAEQEEVLGATRAVVCEAPAERLSITPHEQKEAA